MTAVQIAGAASVPTIVAGKALGLEARAAAASERLTLGVIGFGPPVSPASWPPTGKSMICFVWFVGRTMI